MKELEFLLVSDAYTRLLYLELALLCPSWGWRAPWRGT